MSSHALAADAEDQDRVTLADLGAVPIGGADGAVWSLPHGGDLDANLVRLGPDATIGEHDNSDVDVLVYVQSGSGELIVAGEVHPLASEHLALIPRGRMRSVRAGSRGLVYLSIHRRRLGLAVKARPE